MNAEQKKRIAHEISNWRNARNDHSAQLTGDRMADLLQELIEAPAPEPVLVVETEPGYWNRGHYHEGTKSYIDPTKVWGLPVGTKLYTAPPAPSVPAPEPVARVTGYYAGYLSIATVDGRVLPAGTALYAAPPHQSEHHLEMVNTPAPSVPKPVLVARIDTRENNLRCVDWEVPLQWLKHGTELYTVPPAPSVPDVELQAAFDRGLKAGNEQKDAQQAEIHRLHGLLAAAPTPAEAPADLVQDSVASEPVGYLYTNLRSGEYHVSDADDDYRGPERVLWCIEPVYRRAKGKQA